MDFSSRTRALSSLANELKSGKYNFNHPLQRKEGQWNRLQKSELIDTMLRPYPIDPIRVIQEDDKFAVIDGKQRLTTIRDFIQNNFRLSKTLSSINIEGIDYEIAGKKFDDLDEAVKDKLNNYEVILYIFTGCTDNDIREMFRRQNNSAPLSKSQKATVYISTELGEKIQGILEHEFWSKTAITAGQSKKSEDRDLVIESMMLISNYEITGFNSKDLVDFIKHYTENPQPELFDFLRIALDRLNEVIPEKQKNMKKLTVPMVIYGMNKAIKNKKSTEKYGQWLMDFFANYESNEEYLQYCKSQTTRPDNVQGRLSYFRKAVNAL